MRERNFDPIQNTIDLAILNSLTQQSLDCAAIERHIQRVRAMLALRGKRWLILHRRMKRYGDLFVAF
jgi:hypothetical protein